LDKTLYYKGGKSELNKCQDAKAYLRTKWHVDQSNCLATIHPRCKQKRQTR